MNNHRQLKSNQPFKSKSFRTLKNDLSKFPLLRTQDINYKNMFLLRKYISIEGKILPRRLTNLSSKKQRYLAKSIKNARILGFLPFIREVIY